MENSKPQKHTEIHQQKNKTSSNFSKILTLIIIIFILFIVYNKFDKIIEAIWWTAAPIENSNTLQIWQQVSIEWIINNNWDLINYTHTLSTTSNWTFGIKSKNINLSQYTWDISIEWTVSNQIDSMFIIDVISIIWNFSTDNMQDTWIDLSSIWTYISRAWMYFSEDFKNTYTLNNNWENDEIKLTNNSNNQSIRIAYFRCKAWDSNTDCTELKKTFWSTAETKLTINNWDTIYKLPDTNSWFLTNDLFWYFLNDAPATEITNLSNYISIPNKKFVNDVLLPQVSKICIDWDVILTDPDSNKLIIDNDKITLKLTSKINSWNAECKITVDPSLSIWWTKASFYYPTPGTNTNSTDSNTSTQTNNNTTLTQDPSIKQFPINLEKALEYISSKRWFKIIFPSSNISYASTNTSTNLDINWANCYVQTNVIVYKDKAMIDTNPSIQIYECKLKNGTTVPSNYITKSISDGRTYIIDVIDPSRVDFANNINIEILE